MKLPLKESFLARSLLVSTAITILFVLFGAWLNSELNRIDRESNRFRPSADHVHVINRLITEDGMSAEKALEIVRATQPPHFRDGYHMVKDGEPTTNDEDVFALVDGTRIAIHKREKRHGMMGMGPGGPGGPAPRTFGIGLTIAVVTLVMGLLSSYLIVIWMLKRKAKDAASALEKLEKGDLDARIPVGSTDEFTGLAAQFNQMAAAIQQLVQNLRETEETRRTMLAELAHDLRTPVASLKASTEILESKWQLLNDEKRGELTGMVLRETEYFQKLVDDLLFLSGVEDPRYRPAFRTIDMGALVEEVAMSLGDPKIQLSLMPQILVNGDEILLRRMITNVLTNSLRFSRERVSVELTTGRLSIKDDGRGFTQEELTTYGKRKFTRRWEREEGGHLSIGLGSTIVAKIANLHLFKLQVRNHEQGGAQVSFEF